MDESDIAITGCNSPGLTGIIGPYIGCFCPSKRALSPGNLLLSEFAVLDSSFQTEQTHLARSYESSDFRPFSAWDFALTVRQTTQFLKSATGKLVQQTDWTLFPLEHARNSFTIHCQDLLWNYFPATEQP